MNTQHQIEVAINPYKGLCQSAVALSFDYETSAISRKPRFYKRFKGRLKKIYFTLKNTSKDLSPIYGRGYANRLGAGNIMHIFQKYNLHGTWFSTGHVLLKENTQGDAFRINQVLPYMRTEAGFAPSLSWRSSTPTFSQEPFKDYWKFPFWYLGDQAEELKSKGEDIQCHTFSHPFVALESIENLSMDISDWQSAAIKNGFNTANILAFPYLGDAYRYYYNLDLKAHPGLKIEGQSFKDFTISDLIIQVLEQNGIELVTRCISRVGESRYTSFVPYENSNLYYMPDMNFNPGSPKFELVRKKIGEVVGGGSALNIWMHPNNVFTPEEKKNFEKLVKFLKVEASKTHIWLTTILEMWQHFKKAKNCRVEVKPEGFNIYEAIIHNGNQSSIEQLGMIFNTPHITLANRDRNISYRADRVLIGKLKAKEIYRFKFLKAG